MPNLKSFAEKARFGALHVRRLAGFGPKPPVHDAEQAERAASVRLATPDTTHFSQAYCLNCGAVLVTPHCGDCGQARARRFDLMAVGSLAWASARQFEMSLVQGFLAVLKAPGTVAREFVLGARKRHVHPLTLLLTAIGLMLLVATQSRYLDTRDAQLTKAMELVRAYGNWSFSLGIVAILAATQSVLRWRQPFNITEHLVLGVYTHFLIICASALNLLPTLIWRDAAFLAAHKASSAWYMDGVEALLLMITCQQFFLLEWRKHWWRLVLAAAVFVIVKTALLRLYAVAIVKLVLAQLA
ncbi:MAG: DUF3667 domain-containing protein [Ahniella sp.]|nr:DUF3667 domain-containing protein [Ahniella sp.]